MENILDYLREVERLQEEEFDRRMEEFDRQAFEVLFSDLTETGRER